MTARHGAWHLVDFSSDPVPGTPTEVGDEGSDYVNIADDIVTQVSRLRRIADGNELVGEYADGLTHSVSELADHLGKMEDRFRTVGGLLVGLEAPMQTARDLTWEALGDAEDVQTAENNKTDEERAEDSPFDDPYEAAKSKARSAVNTWENKAEEVAGKIRSASDDDMKDSTWDKVKAFVGKIAPFLDALADLLGYIALALIVISLFIPGLNILTALIILGVTALALRTLLAATGNGSWMDVAFEVVGLLTLGAGKAFSVMAKASRGGLLTRMGLGAGFKGGLATFMRSGRGPLRMFKGPAAFRGAWDDAGRAFANLTNRGTAHTTTSLRNVFTGDFWRLNSQMRAAIPFRTRLRFIGDGELAGMADDLAKLSPGFLNGLSHRLDLGLASLANLSGFAVPAISKILDPDIGSGPAEVFDPYTFDGYNDFSNHFVNDWSDF